MDGDPYAFGEVSVFAVHRHSWDHFDLIALKTNQQDMQTHSYQMTHATCGICPRFIADTDFNEHSVDQLFRVPKQTKQNLWGNGEDKGVVYARILLYTLFI